MTPIYPEFVPDLFQNLPTHHWSIIYLFPKFHEYLYLAMCLAVAGECLSVILQYLY